MSKRSRSQAIRDRVATRSRRDDSADEQDDEEDAGDPFARPRSQNNPAPSGTVAQTPPLGAPATPARTLFADEPDESGFGPWIARRRGPLEDDTDDESLDWDYGPQGRGSRFDSQRDAHSGFTRRDLVLLRRRANRRTAGRVARLRNTPAQRAAAHARRLARWRAEGAPDPEERDPIIRPDNPFLGGMQRSLAARGAPAAQPRTLDELVAATSAPPASSAPAGSSTGAPGPTAWSTAPPRAPAPAAASSTATPGPTAWSTAPPRAPGKTPAAVDDDGDDGDDGNETDTTEDDDGVVIGGRLWDDEGNEERSRALDVARLADPGVETTLSIRQLLAPPSTALEMSVAGPEVWGQIMSPRAAHCLATALWLAQTLVERNSRCMLHVGGSMRRGRSGGVGRIRSREADSFELAVAVATLVASHFDPATPETLALTCGFSLPVPSYAPNLAVGRPLLTPADRTRVPLAVLRKGAVRLPWQALNPLWHSETPTAHRTLVSLIDAPNVPLVGDTFYMSTNRAESPSVDDLGLAADFGRRAAQRLRRPQQLYFYAAAAALGTPGASRYDRPQQPHPTNAEECYITVRNLSSELTIERLELATERLRENVHSSVDVLRLWRAVIERRERVV